MFHVVGQESGWTVQLDQEFVGWKLVVFEY